MNPNTRCLNTPEHIVNMKNYLSILERADQGKLPERLDSSSDISTIAAQELIDAGYLKAIDASSSDGVAYLDPKITLAGREYLAQLSEQLGRKQGGKKKQMDKPLDVAITSISINNAWKEIKKEYDISKKLFAIKINFVEDQFKKEVIFRDVAQAFLLAYNGFNKPAVILAGGAVEELLRLYLAAKKVVPTCDTLDAYIKACEENRLLKNAISKLADSVRQFRNLVHLKKESSAKHTISKATAKGSVAIIFTIANDFE